MNKKRELILGDVVAIAILTYIGFATHYEIDLFYLLRMWTTFFPVLIGWFLIAPWLGLFDDEVTANFTSLWRVLLAMLLSAPLAVVLRAVLLQSSASPFFVLILGGSNALGMLAWRLAYWLKKRE
jgi:hypothetical protein